VSEGLEPAPAADRVRRSLESLDRELGRITAHIDALLRLIGAPQEPPLRASLAALLEECQRDVGTAARHRGVELRVGLDSDVPLRQHEVLRRALLLVLVDALERAAPGSAVQLEVGRENGRVVAALAWRPAGAQRDSERAELDLAPARALLHRCGGELDEQGEPGAPVLRLRFPVEVES
jgi:signal transduction histidine kinase